MFLVLEESVYHLHGICMLNPAARAFSMLQGDCYVGLWSKTFTGTHAGCTTFSLSTVLQTRASHNAACFSALDAFQASYRRSSPMITRLGKIWRLLAPARAASH